MQSFEVVQGFEAEVASFAGAKHCITTNTGTSAIFLSLAYERQRLGRRKTVICPANTYVSVAHAILQADFDLQLVEMNWFGSYKLAPTYVIDSALRFRPKMYSGGLECISFHARKLLNIGEGGAVLTDDPVAAEWLRAARYSGRRAPGYRVEDIDMMGWQCYMTPEKAARGLHLMTYIRDVREQLPDQAMQYPDLRLAPFFEKYAASQQ